MARLPNHVIGAAQTSRAAWDVLSDLVDIGSRMAGQDGEAQGADVIGDTFRRHGLDSISVSEFPIDGWWRDRSTVTVDTPRERTFDSQHEVLSLPGSPSATVEGRLVDVGTGTPAEFDDTNLENAIAMASSRSPEDHERWIHRMEKYVCAAEAGAVAFVFRNHVEGCLPPTGEVGYHNRPGPIPAVGVSKEVGERLLRSTEERAVSATLTVASRSDSTTSRNVEARVGPETDETVLVTAHIDAHDIAEGANDNGAGSALVTEVGRLLSMERSLLDTEVRLITFGSEEIGLWGAYHWTNSHDLSDVKAVLNLDGAGGGRTLGVNANGFSDLEAAITDAADRLDVPLEDGSTISPHGDQWAFVQEGVPSAMCYAHSDSAGRGYGHTHADTLDKLDPRDLRALAIVITEAVVEVADSDREIDRKSRSDIREQIDEGYERELKRGGRWPYSE